MVKMLIGFRRRPGMSVQAFKDYRRDVHAPLLFAIPEAANIRRFVVSYPVAAANWPEPTFDAVVEAWFDTMSEMDALFLSDNFRTQVDPDHVNFIDLTSISRIVSEEVIVIPGDLQEDRSPVTASEGKFVGAATGDGAAVVDRLV